MKLETKIVKKIIYNFVVLTLIFQYFGILPTVRAEAVFYEQKLKVIESSAYKHSTVEVKKDSANPVNVSTQFNFQTRFLTSFSIR